MRYATPWATGSFLVASVVTAQTSDPGALYKKSIPSLVKIEARNLENQPEWTGSGFLVSADGMFVTNFHVIRNSKRATVRLSNGDAYDEVLVVAIDKRRDIALLRIKAAGLTPLQLGNSSEVEVGQTIYSLGNPLGLDNTLSNGIVSAIRPMDGYRLLQITAPISPGSSGGPLLDSKGNVIGITVASLASGQNLNFAIPIDYAKGMIATPGPLTTLESVYDPEAQPEPTATSTRLNEPKLPANPSATPPAPPIETGIANYRALVQKSLVGFLTSKLFTLSESDARGVFGQPGGQRLFYDARGSVVGDIYDWADVTRQSAHFELAFNSKTNLLTNVFIYPAARIPWSDVKKTFGDTKEQRLAPQGNKLRSYPGKRMNVILDKDDVVLSFGYY